MALTNLAAARTHEWIDIADAILKTMRISSRLAPASRAVRIWRRLPSGLRLVQAAFKPTLTSAANLRGESSDP
jgi:hypothetical protein